MSGRIKPVVSPGRKALFLKLKPSCVQTSHLILQHQQGSASSQVVIDSLEELLNVLKEVAAPSIDFDPQLADYVFFPLSHCFRDVKKLPLRAVELSLQCVQILIRHGWKSALTKDLGKQLLILLTFIVDGGRIGANGRQETSQHEEVVTAAFSAIAAVIDVCKAGCLTEHGSVPVQNVPILGHTVTVLLDGAVSGASHEVQATALSALSLLVLHLEDLTALRNILPGIVSSMAKLLAGQSPRANTGDVLVFALKVLKNIIVRLFKDDSSVQISASRTDGSGEQNQQGITSQDPWISGTAPQIKAALAAVLGARHDSRLPVKIALAETCLALVSQCSMHLENCMRLLVETIIIITASTEEPQAALTTISSTAQGVFRKEPILEHLKEATYDWCLSLPRVMSSQDERKKLRLLRQVSQAYNFLSQHGELTELLQSVMYKNFISALHTQFQMNGDRRVLVMPDGTNDLMKVLKTQKHLAPQQNFPDILLTEPSNREILSACQQTMSQIQSSSSGHFNKILVNRLSNQDDEEMLAVYWTIVQTMRQSQVDAAESDQFINAENTIRPSIRLLDEVYSFALANLSQSTLETDSQNWRTQAISLEVIALQSSHMRIDFRPELIDALFPILERLGSTHRTLQSHAVTCLNVVSRCCEYDNVVDLIVDNADYLVNTIALRLNSFDISPQAPKVLIMMIRLCGAPLVPFLDDLVESIFSILACYHGYPKLVESLFGVFNAIVEETSKTKVPLIQGAGDSTTRPLERRPMQLSQLLDKLKKKQNRALKVDDNEKQIADQGTSIVEESDEINEANEDNDESSENGVKELIPDDQSTTLPQADPPAPRPAKPFTLVSKITSLAPAHLGSPSSSVRASILALLTNAFPLLAIDTNTLLPVAAQQFNHLLDCGMASDAQPFEVLAAVQALTALGRSAGDFLAGRISDSWKKLQQFYHKLEKGAKEEVRMTGGRRGGMNWRCWDAMIEFFITCIMHIGLDEAAGAEDDMFDILGPWTPQGSSQSMIENRDTNKNGHGHGHKHDLPLRSSHMTLPRKVDEALVSSLGSKAPAPASGPPTVRQSILPTTERIKEITNALHFLNADHLWLIGQQVESDVDCQFRENLLAMAKLDIIITQTSNKSR